MRSQIWYRLGFVLLIVVGGAAILWVGEAETRAMEARHGDATSSEEDAKAEETRHEESTEHFVFSWTDHPPEPEVFSRVKGRTPKRSATIDGRWSLHSANSGQTIQTRRLNLPTIASQI